MAIKLTQEQVKAVRNYNRRLKYLESYGVQYLPEHVRVRDLRKDFKTQRDLNRRLKQLEKFNAANAKRIVRVGKDGVKMSAYQRDIMQADRRLAINRTKREMAKIQKEKGTQQWDFMYGPRYNKIATSLKKLQKETKEMTKDDVSKVRAIGTAVKEKFKRDRTFVSNLVTIMFENERLIGNTNIAQVNRITKMFEQLDPERALNIYNNSRSAQYMVEFYDIYKQIRRDAHALGKEIKKYHNHLDILEFEVAAAYDAMLKEEKQNNTK